MNTPRQPLSNIAKVEIDGNMPIARFLRALASAGLTLQFNSATNCLRVIESPHADAGAVWRKHAARAHDAASDRAPVQP